MPPELSPFLTGIAVAYLQLQNDIKLAELDIAKNAIHPGLEKTDWEYTIL